MPANARRPAKNPAWAGSDDDAEHPPDELLPDDAPEDGAAVPLPPVDCPGENTPDDPPVPEPEPPPLTTPPGVPPLPDPAPLLPAGEPPPNGTPPPDPDPQLHTGQFAFTESVA